MMQQKELYEILDKTACFNTLGLPDPDKPSRALTMPDDAAALSGVRIHGLGHRFQIEMEPPSLEQGLRARNTVGKEAISFDFSWLVAPDDFKAAPDAEPPPTKFDPARSQHFVLKDSVFDFGGGSRLMGFGVGRTFPTGADERVRLAANGAIFAGSGKFDERPSGIWVLGGVFEPPGDFNLNLLIRVVDAGGGLFADALPPIEPIDNPDQDTTYLILRCHNQAPMVQVYFSAEEKMPNGMPMPNGTRNLQNISGFHCDFALGDDGPVCQRSTGPHMGFHSVALTGNLGPTPEFTGMPNNPIPFDDKEGFFIYDAEGEGIGGFGADVVEGQTIFARIPGIPMEVGANVAGGFGPVNYGTGFFQGAEGMVINVGTGSIMPNLIELTYIAAFDDPDGKYRA